MAAGEATRIRGPDARTTFLGAAAGALGLFGAIAAAMLTGVVAGWDRTVFGSLYSGDSDWPLGPTPGQGSALLQEIVPALYWLADTRKLVLAIAAVAVLLAARRRFRAAAFYLGCVAAAGASVLLKPLFERSSPFPATSEFSFPSGHAMLSMSMVAGLVLLALGRPWLWPVAVAGALLVVAVAVAVVADGGHWPSDVAAGWTLALAWALALRGFAGDPLAGGGR